MDVHGVGDVGVGRAGVHGVEDAVDGFVSAGAEDGGSEDFFGFGVDEDLHEALRLAFLYGAADFGHGTSADEGGLAGISRPGLRSCRRGRGVGRSRGRSR